MTKQELIYKLNELGIKEVHYSLNGKTKNQDISCIVLIEKRNNLISIFKKLMSFIYSLKKWQIYYIDKNGEKYYKGEFNCIINALFKIYKLFKERKVNELKNLISYEKQIEIEKEKERIKQKEKEFILFLNDLYPLNKIDKEHIYLGLKLFYDFSSEKVTNIILLYDFIDRAKELNLDINTISFLLSIPVEVIYVYINFKDKIYPTANNYEEYFEGFIKEVLFQLKEYS